MKIRTFITAFLIFVCISTTLLYTNASQPLNNKEMITQAIQSRNTPELIKALISEMKESLEKDSETLPDLIRQTEEYTSSETDPATKALLHSMVAQMYNSYYQNNRWRIDQRTSISGYTPEDIREWSKNLFTEKIKEELKKSLEPATVLQQTQARRFQEIMTLGENSPELRPTLYDFLAYRALDIQPSTDIYTDLIRFRKAQNNPKALLLAELDYLRYNKKNTEEYAAGLDSLLQLNKDKDYSVEIIIRKLEYLRGQEGILASADSVKSMEYQLSKETINRFPSYQRIEVIKNWLQVLEMPMLEVTADRTVYPGKELKLSVRFNNLQDVKVSIYKSVKTPEEYPNPGYIPINKEEAQGEMISEQTFTLSPRNTFTVSDTSLYIPVREMGLYECVVTASGMDNTSKFVFSSSRLASLYRSLSQNTREILVTDYQTGKPLQGVEVIYYKGKRNEPVKAGTVKTDKNGIAQLPGEKDIYGYRAVSGEDRNMLITSVYPYNEYVQVSSENTAITLLTDRGLYRPGQTVFFKGIVYNTDKKDPRVVPNQSVQVVLRDANNKEVTSRSFTTNSFGSFNGEFTLPAQGLTGSYQLSAGNNYAFIQVEEYKRPSFQITFSPITEEIKFGDNLTIRGNAQTYSGVSLESGAFTYRIVRRPFWFRSLFFPVATEQVAEGSGTIGDDGTFTIPFQPQKTQSSNRLPQLYTYDISVTMTDSRGESQEGRYSFSVGEKTIILYANLPEQIEKEKAELLPEAFTLNNSPVNVSGIYKIYTLDENMQTGEYTEKQQVATGSFRTGEKLPADVFRKLSSGRFRLKLEAKDSRGEEIEYQKDFVLYSKQDKRPPVYQHIWLPEQTMEVKTGEPIEVIFGTSDKEAYILYEIFAGDNRVKQERFVLTNENRQFTIPFAASYGDNVFILYTFVKEGKTYSGNVSVQKKYPDRSLTIKPETFRDKLQPGSQESWKFRITDADSLAVAAEILAGMYDASLDQILPFQWNFSPQRNSYFNFYQKMFADGFGMGSATMYGSFSSPYRPVPDYQFDQIDWQGVMDIGVYATRSYSRGGIMMKTAAPAAPNVSMAEESADMLQENPVVSDQQENSQTQEVISPIRTNFNETAFFYPTLTTDEKGSFVINFNIPESNTTWKFQALAHTTDLKYGLLTEKVLTQKPLMVLPYVPRFLRIGDQVTMSSRIMNQSDQTIKGLARIELFDPANNEPVICLTKSQQPFELTAGSSTTVSWKFTVPEQIELLGYRIIADSDSGSDGEQHLIPVVSNEILVTESRPFYLREEGEKTINLNVNASATQKPYRMTLEIAGNPVWYVVQALPTITQPANDNILSWFASYYANTVTAYIIQSSPRLQEIIRAWTAQGGTANTLYSNLQKNEELKNILLEETPWVLEAENETEQKQRLALLFDMNRTSQQRETALRKLQEQQLESGGWGWFKGFYPNRRITTFILKVMGEMVEMGAMASGQAEKEMQMLALKYLDKRMEEDYAALKRTNQNPDEVLPTGEQLEYLYMRSFYRDIPELGSAREAIRFYTNQAEKRWEKTSLYGKAEIGILMYRNGKKEVATNILNWFVKTATISEEQGMFWANNRRGMDFFVSPIDVHTMIMRFFQEASPDQLYGDQMKQWLLNQKQTQKWETTPATLNAISSILFTGSNWLNENNRIYVQWGKQTYDTSGGEIATGYIKESISGNQITSDRQTIHLRKEGKAPAWGAVYNQYFERIDLIKKQAGDLSVEKKLFVEGNSGTERLLIPVTSGRALKVGEKAIVRLTIRTGRAMDFVHLKDLRAGCFEPTSQLSGFSFNEGIMYYHSPKDLSENFFFEHLPVGTFVLEYAVYVSRSGQYSSGISSIQCLYAPEFVSHTEGDLISVEE